MLSAVGVCMAWRVRDAMRCGCCTVRLLQVTDSACLVLDGFCGVGEVGKMGLGNGE